MTRVQVDFLQVGHCRHLACMAVRDAPWRSREFPAYCALLRHPDAGYLLFDTGYAHHFRQSCAQLPEKLYTLALPYELNPEQQLTAQLQARGVAPTQIGGLVISHFHGDHVAGLKDFPRAQFYASRADCQHLQSLGRWRATTEGIVPGLLPDDFWQRLTLADRLPVRSLPRWMAPFQQGWDLLGDGSLLLVELAGHSAGQLGLLIPESQTGPVFLCADACWSLPACQRGVLPSRAVGLFTHDWAAYRQTFFALSALSRRETSLAVLPSHCPDAFNDFHGRSH